MSIQKWGFRCALILAFFAHPLISHAQQPSNLAESHLAGGEFAGAKAALGGIPRAGQDNILRQIAGLQASGGELSAASATSMGIANFGDGQSMPGAAGGGAVADFDSLMELIQTTVAPDTWEALGGPSTMSPYAAGVVVQPAGLIRDVVGPEDSGSLESLRMDSLLASGDFRSEDWRAPAKLRKVSLRRLQRALLMQLHKRSDPTGSMLHLAGLSRIQYMFIDEVNRDIIIAGPVGGVVMNGVHPVDAQSGRATLSLDALGLAFHATENPVAYGCTIEPTREGIVRTRAVQAEIHNGSLPIAGAKDRIAEALGKQEIRVFGMDANSDVALLLVQADRHMKQLALGDRKMPRGVSNYLDFVGGTIKDNPLTGDLLRLWFAPKAVSVRADSDKRAFELAGMPMQLLSEQEVSDATGLRQRAANQDPRAKLFAEEFNKNIEAIARQYPLYERLRGVYEVASVAQLIKLYVPSDLRNDAIGVLSHPEGWIARQDVAPTHTESLVVYRKFKIGRTAHSVLVASGGVQVNPSLSVSQKLVSYPSLSHVASEGPAPKRVDRWWWD